MQTVLSSDTTLQNRYHIVRELGHGGMGTVYEAIDQRVNCVVALKQTLATGIAGTRKHFEHEAALLANLRHQGLPKVMDYFSEEEGDFLVMEFIAGFDLAELLDLRGGPFPQSQVLGWAYQLLDVLEYLHELNPPIIHRDIKPANVKLTQQGKVVLLDFGLAKGALGQMPTYETGPSVRGHTPPYASLEQFHGHTTDARSDLYSLGATLYHLISGTVPVNAGMRSSIIEDDHPDPVVVPLEEFATPRVAAVINQAMAISRKERPASAAEMRQTLRNATEEDDRNSIREEYHRAEAKHREREEERRRAADEEARVVEEKRRQDEAETRKKEDAARRKEAERLRIEKDAARQFTEERERQHLEEQERRRLEAQAQEARRHTKETERVRAKDQGARDPKETRQLQKAENLRQEEIPHEVTGEKAKEQSPSREGETPNNEGVVDMTPASLSVIHGANRSGMSLAEAASIVKTSESHNAQQLSVDLPGTISASQLSTGKEQGLRPFQSRTRIATAVGMLMLLSMALFLFNQKSANFFESESRSTYTVSVSRKTKIRSIPVFVIALDQQLTVPN